MTQRLSTGPMPDPTVTAPNGVIWKRNRGGSSSAAEFIAALEAMKESSSVRAQRNWWQDGRAEREHDLIWDVVKQWDHATPPSGGYVSDGELQARLDAKHAELEQQRQARAACYDQEQAMARLRLLRVEATARFMQNVLRAPASAAQKDKAEELLAASQQEAGKLNAQVDDPETVTDERGDLPAARREHHLFGHMTFFRHPTLREWSTGQRQRFKQLLAMPPLEAAQMCPECQAPADWHSYGVSLRLWQGTPEPGSTAAKIAALIPGWWDRCPASTDYQLRHQWGADALPDFGGEQWQAMLTPVLRAVFAPGEPRKPKAADRRAMLTRRLRAAEAEAERLRGQLAEIEPGHDGRDNNHNRRGQMPPS